MEELDRTVRRPNVDHADGGLVVEVDGEFRSPKVVRRVSIRRARVSDGEFVDERGDPGVSCADVSVPGFDIDSEADDRDVVDSGRPSSGLAGLVVS